MNVLTIENLSKSYSEKILFHQISLGISEGDKIGLIGVNGVGKSTFLKVLAGLEIPDEGKITVTNKARIEYLPQNPYFDEGATVLEQVFKGTSPVMQLLKQYESTVERLNEEPENEKLQKEILALNAKMDALNAWQQEKEAKMILTKLGVEEFHAKMKELSGGQKKRIALASALINPAELLILDEPTNHIDNHTVAWLEEYLSKFKGALLMVTHDRYFLDRVSNRVIELEQGQLYSYSGNYSEFLEKKLEREELQEVAGRKRERLLQKELAWIRKGAKARTTKQKARIDRFEKLQSEQGVEKAEKMELSSAASRLGKKIIELEHVEKCYGDRTLIKDFNYILLRDDRVGIIGPNGSGKSTLMNIIAGQIQPDSGEVNVGITVKVGYFTQEAKEMDESLRVIEYIREGAEYILTAEGERISASQMLERFLFSPAVQWTPIAKLSGGERRRLYLLRILMEAPNILLLDEPTNDLDIQTLTLLEDYLDDFQGAVIAVSHDRYFLDRMAEKIFAFEGNGSIQQYTGNYTEYIQIVKENAAGEEPKKEKDKETAKKEPDKKERPLKFTYKEQREYEQIDSMIEKKEQELEELKAQIDAMGSNFEKLQQLLPKQETAEQELEELMNRWMYLNELAERIGK